MNEVLKLRTKKFLWIIVCGKLEEELTVVPGKDGKVFEEGGL